MKKTSKIRKADVKKQPARRTVMPRLIPSYVSSIEEPPWSFGLLKLIGETNWALRMVYRALRQEILGPGWTIDSRFVSKCTVCNAEYDKQIDVCTEVRNGVECGGKTREPSEEEYQRIEGFLHPEKGKPNPDYSWKDLFASSIWYDNICGIFWWSIGYSTVKLNGQAGQGTPIIKIPSTVYVEDPEYMRFATDPANKGRLGNGQYFCPTCYEPDVFHVKEQATAFNMVCPKCGDTLLETCYVQMIGSEIKARFGFDEIIVGSTDRVLPKLYPTPRPVALWKQLLSGQAMDDYNYQVYKKGNVGGILAFPGYDNEAQIKSLEKQILDQETKQSEIDPVSGYPTTDKKIRNLMLATKETPVLIRIMHDLQAMQSLDWQKFWRDGLASVYGVTPVFISVIESGRCLIGRTTIWTTEGSKKISKLQKGDYVWCGCGKPTQVTDVYTRTHKGDFMNVQLFGAGRRGGHKDHKTGRSASNSIVATSDHQFLTDKGWMEARNLTPETQVYLASTNCEECGKPIPWYKTACDITCHNRRISQDPVIKEKAHTKQLQKRGMSGFEKVVDELIRFITPDRFRYVGDGKVWIKGKCPDWINEGEKKIIELSGLYNVNFDVPGRTVRDRLDEKVKIFQDAGYDVLVIKGKDEAEIFSNALQLVPQFMKHHCGSIKLVPQRIIKTWPTKYPHGYKVYDIQVACDCHSFIANGVVVHNSGNNPRMQIDVQSRTTREGQDNLAVPINTFLIPKLGIKDWILTFEKTDPKDDLRDARTKQIQFQTAFIASSAGFDVKLDDFGELEISGEATPGGAASQQPGVAGLIPHAPRQAPSSQQLPGEDEGLQLSNQPEDAGLWTLHPSIIERMKARLSKRRRDEPTGQLRREEHRLDELQKLVDSAKAKHLTKDQALASATIIIEAAIRNSMEIARKHAASRLGRPDAVLPPEAVARFDLRRKQALADFTNILEDALNG